MILTKPLTTRQLIKDNKAKAIGKLPINLIFVAKKKIKWLFSAISCPKKISAIVFYICMGELDTHG